jgi:hypothetical protein
MGRGPGQISASLSFRRAKGDSVVFRYFLRTGLPYMSDEAKAASRLPAGHPEGYLEAFANVYRLAIADLRRLESGEAPVGGYPTVHDGLRGKQFITKVVESSRKGGIWIDF